MRLKSKVGISGVSAAVGGLAIAGPAVAQGVIYQNDFDDDPVGVYTVGQLDADWKEPAWDNGIEQRRGSIVGGDDAYAGRSLRIDYPQGGVGPNDQTGGGAQWKLRLDDAYDELYLSYRVRFGEGFDFVRGGKLPGLIGGAGNTGGSIPDGTDGWSARMMWRTDGSGGSTTGRDRAQLVQYLYHPDMPGSSGDDRRYDDAPGGDWLAADADRWYTLQHRVVMNTPGTNGEPGLNDGILQAWVDGVLVLDERDVRFRDVGSLAIDQVYFSTFFGGGSAAWAPTRDESVYFDDFVVSTEAIIPEPAGAALGAAAALGVVSRRLRR